MNFGIIDWIILVVYLAFSVYMGLRAKKFVENADGYFVAGRKVKVALGLATLVATEIGTVTFMYLSEIGYVTGFACFFMGLVGAVGFFMIGKTGFLISKLRDLKIVTIPEFYGLRFNKNVRILGGIILFLSGVLNMGIFLKFDGIFLAETMGFGQGVLVIIMIIMLIIVISYTILGGMLSVVVTDFMQFVILSVGMFVATIAILYRVSFTEMVVSVTQNYGNAGFNPFENARFGWVFVLWMMIGSFTIAALSQPVAAKSFSSESAEVGRKVFRYYGLTLAGRSVIPMLWGIAALTIFGPNLNPLLAMPKLISLIVPSGLLGLLIAGFLAASMSTYSAYLLSWSSVATRDIINPLRKKAASDKSTINLTRIIALVIGIFLLFFGLLYQLPATAVQYLALTGAMYTSGAFSVVAGGLYWKKANSIGAYTAIALGAILPLGAIFLDKVKYLIPKNLQFLIDVNISGFLSLFLPVIGMVIGSLLTQKSHPPISIQSLLEKTK